MTDSPMTPWNSIEGGIVDFAQRRLSHADAMASPCASCPTSPCCTYLQVHTFQVRTVAELDQAVYLLNFEHIELGLSPSGDWGVYYR